jgi:hypothetical protein
MLQAMASVQTQVTFMPPVHFSNLKVQRGTMTMLPTGVGEVPIPGVAIPGIPMPVRSIIIVLDIVYSFVV